MSRPLNNLACTLVEIPLKTFIKEKSDDSKSEKKKKFKFEFKADEAKLAYDEIISYKTQRKSEVPKYNIESIKHKHKLNSVESVKNVDVLKIGNTDEKNINTLYKAIELGDTRFVNQHFNSENVNICDQFGWTPLMSAAYSGHTKIVDFLLKLHANTNVTDKSGFTAVDLAFKKNHLNVVNLIQQHVNTKKRKKLPEDNKKYNDYKNDHIEIDEKGFYCDICKIIFMESSRKKHESSTLHVFNSEPKLRNTFYGIPKQNKGYQMLLNTGWNEEIGLGPSGEGQKYPIKTILKRDRKGLGQSHKSTARITHFNSRDTNAIKYVNKSKKKYNKKEWEKQIKKDIIKTKTLRQALS